MTPRQMEGRLAALQQMFVTFIFGEMVRAPDAMKRLGGIRREWLDKDATPEYREAVEEICALLAAMHAEYRRQKN